MAAFDDGLRLVAVLRDPVDRAYSHYHHARSNGWETMSFEEALAAEDERLAGEIERLEEDPATSGRTSTATRTARGRYVEPIERWLSFFDGEQLLVVGSGRLAERPQAVIDEVAEHVGLPRFETSVRERRNIRSYPPMDASVREGLEAYYEPSNEELFDLLGRELDW